MSAMEIRALRNLSTKLVKSEERGKLLWELKKAGMGVREIEEFVGHEMDKLRGTYNQTCGWRTRWDEFIP